MPNSKLHRCISNVTSSLCSLFEFISSIVLTVFLGPILFILFFINEIVRLIITFIFYFQSLNSENIQLSLISDGADGIWGYQKLGNSRNILILYVYNSQMCLETFRQNYQNKVLNYTDVNGVRPYQKLTKNFRVKYGYYCWEECRHFDIKNHIHHIYDNKDEIVTESDVFKYMSTLSKDMITSQPQWEEILIPHFVYDDDISNGIAQFPDRSARIYRSHHAYMDGCSNLLMAATCMGDPEKRFPYVLDPTAPINVSTWKQRMCKVTCVFFGILTAIKSLYAAARIKSRFLMTTYSRNQKFTWSPPLDLSSIRSIKEKTKVSVPAILSSATIGALRRLDDVFPYSDKPSRFDSSPKGISLGLVGAILPYPDIHPKNRFTVVNFTTFGKRDESRLSRLGTTQKEIRHLTQRPDGLVAYTVFQIFGKLPAFMIQALMSGARTPVIYSNVPWASEKVKLWNEEVNDVAGWMPLLTAAGMGLLSVTYSDKVRLCVISDEACISEPQVKFLISEVQAEIQSLLEECSAIPHFKDKEILNL